MSDVVDLSGYLVADESKLDPKKLGFDPKQMMREILHHITCTQPFFSTFIYSYPIVLVEPDHPVIHTAATDGFNFYFNVLFMKALHDFSDKKAAHEQQQFVVMHEILHLALDSFGRRGARDPERWNHATDYVINAILNGFGITLPNSNVFKKAIETIFDNMDDETKKVAARMSAVTGFDSESDIICLYDSKYDGMTAEQIYELLDDDDAGGDGGGSGDGNGDGSNGGRSRGKSHDVHLGDQFGPKSESDKAKQKSAARSAIMSGAKAHQQHHKGSGRGKLPAGLEFLIGEIKKPRIPWSSMVQAELSDMAPTEYDDSIFDSRYFSSGFTFAGMEPEKFCRIGFITDTSGSMSDDDLIKALSEIYGITQEFDRFIVEVITMDTQPYNHQTFTEENVEEILKYKMMGRGGTYFEPAMEYMANLQQDTEPFDALIFFTDGYGEGWCEKYKQHFKKVIWLLSTPPGAVTPTWGTVIHYDKYEMG
tara:strand:- start:1084 stop:2523 length:1440 start_codon:yes stop_codon:yes gene_type:complete